MSTKPYTEEFKTEAIKQVTERGHKLFVVHHRSGGECA
jgi:transposase-like protein